MGDWHTFGLVPGSDPWLSFELAAPFDLGNGIELTKIPDLLKTADMLPGVLGWKQINLMAEQPSYVLARHYPAESLGDPEPEWRESKPMGKQDYAGELLKLTNLAVWFAQPASTLRFRHLLHVEESSSTWIIRQWQRPDPLLPGRKEIESLSESHLLHAREMNLTIASLDRKGPLWIALRSLWGALVEAWFHNRYVLLWIALEALFGPKAASEVSYRLSQNLAFFLAAAPADRPELFKAVRDDYTKRSAVVHGEGGSVTEREWAELLERAEEWVRKSVVKILTTPGLPSHFKNSDERDKYLRDIVFLA